MKGFFDKTVTRCFFTPSSVVLKLIQNLSQLNNKHMKLKGIDFGKAIGASGIQGFFSENEYKYHHKWWYKRIMGLLGYSLEGMTFCAKTMTLFANKGNAELEDDGVTLKEFLPDCIKPYIWHGIALNAVGLSNIGAHGLLRKNIWQERTKPFMLSFMAIGKTKEERLTELEEFVDVLKFFLLNFKAKIALQINVSCPNMGHNQDELIDEIIPFLETASVLGIPLVPKLNILVNPETAFKISQHPACDAICISNTIPFGQLPDKIDWKDLWGGKEIFSPLAKYGGGGLSGKLLFPLLCEWLDEAEQYEFTKPIIAGGGIMSHYDVETLREYNIVKAISPGSVVFLRPWRLGKIIRTANKLF